uniref:Potassium channel domain-containing protein n=1 Tax=Acrobeloides nanus TaxID=290746 RepID=A0A914C008_9BILA
MFYVIQKIKWVSKKFKLNYFVPFLILISYTVLGAAIFRNLELELDLKQKEVFRNKTDFVFRQILTRMLEIRCNDRMLKDDVAKTEHHIKEALLWFIDELNLTQIITERSAETTSWTWMGALFYAGQLYTTIGYGLPATKTSWGRFASIVYIMIGIPIFLIMLKQIGKLLSRGLRKFYKRVNSAKQKIPDSNAVRRMSMPMKAIYSLTNGSSPTKNGNGHLNNGHEISSCIDFEAQKLDADELVDPEKQNELNQVLQKKATSFPIPLALGLLVLWILASAALFCVWETEWGFFMSIYFFFISISTVGLGDIVPSKPDMMFINFILILIGLALLSMCVDLIQNAIEKIIMQLIEEYVQEIEKIANIVAQDDVILEETATPFEVGMSALARSHEEHGFIKSAKDWIAGKVVDNILVNRLAPESSSESEDEMENEVEEVVVVDSGPKVMLHETATLAQAQTHKVSVMTGDSVSSQGSLAVKKRKKRHRFRGNFALVYNMPTLKTVQAIEAVKLKTNPKDDFRSRIFAKFVTNEKLTRYVDDHVVEPPPHHKESKMVSCEIQTDPITPQRSVSRPPDGDAYCRLESPDNMSMNSKTNETVSTYDGDSLYSTAYCDLHYGYSTESVPAMIAQAEAERRNPQLSTSPKPYITTKEASSGDDPLLAIPGTSHAPQIFVDPIEESSEMKQQKNLPRKVSFRRHSTTATGLLAPVEDDRISMIECPSCQHLATIPSPLLSPSSPTTRQESPFRINSDSLKRVFELCGLTPIDFLRHSLRGRDSRSPSKCSSKQDDSGYEHSKEEPPPSPNSTTIPTTTVMSMSTNDSISMSDSLLTPSLIKSFQQFDEISESDEIDSSEQVQEVLQRVIDEVAQTSQS